jgi:aminocarboxymuconate-semialdehyde decarboxylase
MPAGPSEQPTVDVHAHFVDPTSLAAMHTAAPDHAPRLRQTDEGEWVMDLAPGSLRTHPDGVTRPIPTGLVDVERRLKDMDDQGVDVHALSGYTWLNFYALPGDVAAEMHRIHNDGMVRVARENPTRFLAMPTLPMQSPRHAVEEIERLAAHPEVCGVGVGTNVDGMNLDDPSFEPVWEALDAHDLPVLVHPPGLIAGSDRMRRYHLVNLIGNPVDTSIAAASILFSGVLDRYPRLRFCFVHGGGFLPYQAGRWDHGWSVREETKVAIQQPPTTNIAGRCFFDTLTHDPTALRFLGERFGWQQVLMGTDYPWDMSTTTPLQDIKESAMDDAVVHEIAVDNARAFLRWPTTH